VCEINPFIEQQPTKLAEGLTTYDTSQTQPEERPDTHMVAIERSLARNAQIHDKFAALHGMTKDSLDQVKRAIEARIKASIEEIKE
jgi:hypothetical protein